MKPWSCLRSLHDPIDFSVFRLDLKLGTHSSSSATLVTQLEKSSIAKLINEHIGTALTHMDKLHTRVEDISSEVLVTGDLNAGKSTFVDAILGRPVMPVDQLHTQGAPGVSLSPPSHPTLGNHCRLKF